MLGWLLDSSVCHTHTGQNLGFILNRTVLSLTKYSLYPYTYLFFWCSQRLQFCSFFRSWPILHVFIISTFQVSVIFHSEYGLLDVLDHLYAELEMIRKFAQLEFRHGSVERGKTLFENLVTTYPRRTDIWSVYIDVCIKFGDFDQARWHFVPDFTLENLCVKTLLQMHHSWELGEIWETHVPGIEK